MSISYNTACPWALILPAHHELPVIVSGEPGLLAVEGVGNLGCEFESNEMLSKDGCTHLSCLATRGVGRASD